REVGIYVALYQIANAPISLFSSAMSQFVMPIIFDQGGSMASLVEVRQGERTLRYSLMVAGVVMTCLVACTFLISETLVRILTTPVFAEYHASLWVVTLGLALFHFGQMI